MLHLYRRVVGPEQRLVATQCNELAIERYQLSVFSLRRHRTIELRSIVRFLRLWIGHAIGPAERCKLFASSLAHGFDELVVAMTHEIEEGVRLPVFLAHEQQRNVGR